ncbi:MAG: hypothetical protein ACRELY_10255 [Polyangiaceae bacterium]
MSRDEAGRAPGSRAPRPHLEFATPRKLPKARDLRGRVAVLDLAFASESSGGGFEKLTRPLIDGLGARLAAWVDHHDHVLHAKYKEDPRFVLATKAEHGACPEMITPEIVERAGQVDTIVCHNDFDGLCSAAKWIRGGVEPYPGADDDARAIDTRIGTPSGSAVRIDRALRGRPRDAALYGMIVRHLSDGLVDASLWKTIDEAAGALAGVEAETRQIAEKYRVFSSQSETIANVAFIDATEFHGKYDKTQLLLAGQERAKVALLLDRDTLSVAAKFDSKLNFLILLGISGGMPTVVSLPASRMAEVLEKLAIAPADRSLLLP